MGEIFRARKETQEGSSLTCDMVADRAPQHRVACFDRVDDRADRDRAVHFKLNLAVHVRKRAQVRRQHYANRTRLHAIVWTSTDNTAGRSRTMGLHVSPASAEQYTWPP